MGTLYVLEQGAMIHKHHERLLVRREKATLFEVPLVHVDQVVLFGGVHLTAAAANLLLDRDMPVAMCALSGRLRGFLQPAYDRWVDVRCEQVRRSDDPGFRGRLAREIVATKIRNARTYLRRLHRDGRADAAATADRMADDLAECLRSDDEDSLRGIEGAAAARYFRVLRSGFVDLKIGRRVRSSPDPGGALLNLSYGLLAVDVLRAIQLSGLDPFVGFYHRPRVGRPNLVLDLMEEWRPVLADPTTLAAIRRNVVSTADFERVPGLGARLTNKALKRFLGEYHRRCETTLAVAGRSRTYREWIDLQARKLALSLRRGGPPYKGFTIQ